MANAGTTQFPSVVIDHIYGEALAQWYERFFDEQQLLGVQRDAIEESAWKVYTREHTLDAFLKELEDVFGTPERAHTIVIPILGNDFLKIEDYLGVDIPAYIKALGGDPTLFVKEIPITEVVRGVVGDLRFTFSDPVLAKRLEGAIATHLSGARDTLETKDVLVRSMKVGGVGLDAATADRITSALEEKLRALRDAGVILRKGNDKPPEESTFHLVKPAKSGLMQPEDEEEVERFRHAVPIDPLKEHTRTAVDRIVQKTGAKFKNDDATRRFRSALEARLRDIRDYRETLDFLMRPPAQGGFGIPEVQAKRVLVVVEEEFRVVHGKSESKRMLASGAPSLLAGIASSPAAPRNDKVSDVSKKEVAPTTAITSQLVHPVPPKPLPPPPPPKQIPIAPPPPAKPVIVPPDPPAPPRTTAPQVPPREIATSLPSVAPRNDKPLSAAPPSRTASPLSAATPPAPIVKQIPVAKPPTMPPSPLPTLQVALQQVSRQTPSTPKVPPPQPAPVLAPRVSAPSGKPRLQDIRPVPPRLVGPIEELQRLAIQDFRKIAKLPAEAAARIVEKLALLEKDSYTKRAEGVKGLRGSALMAVYAEVVNAAFLAKRKVEEEVQTRAAKDKEAVTMDEFRALMWLNQQLRF